METYVVRLRFKGYYSLDRSYITSLCPGSLLALDLAQLLRTPAFYKVGDIAKYF
jgi:hypothetical protein